MPGVPRSTASSAPSKPSSGLLQAEGHEVEVFGPDRFRTLPCPTYPEIRLSLFPGARLHHMLKLFAPDAIHLVTEGPLGWAARAFCLQARHALHHAPITRAFPNMSARASAIPSPGATPSCGASMRPRRPCWWWPQSIRDELAARGFRNLVPWSRGVDIAAFKPASTREHSGDPRPIWLYAGRVAVEKNIKAFLDLDLPGHQMGGRRRPAARRLKRRYKDVRFFGSVDTEELACRYAQADCFVFPSRTDTFGLVMVEALASGVPVAGYPVPGPLDVVTNPKVGAVDEDLRTACLARSTLRSRRLPPPRRDLHLGRCAQQFLDNLRQIPRSTWQPLKRRALPDAAAS